MKQPHIVSEQSRRRFLAGELIEKGYDVDEIVEITGADRSSVFRWKKAIRQNGIQALVRKGHSGNTSRLSTEQINELKAIITKGAKEYGFQNERWDSKRIAKVIKEKFNENYNSNYVCELLKRHGLSCQKPTTQSKKRSQEAIEHWRRFSWAAIKKKR
jgi:transposase